MKVAIGTPLVATAAVAHLGPERWHPNPGIFYGRAVGRSWTSGRTT